MTNKKRNASSKPTTRPRVNFEQALRQAKAFADARAKQASLITINSWNEWTEPSYLQPDTKYGYGYLEAVKKVFVEDSK